MNIENKKIGDFVDAIMSQLKAADVLKSDLPDRPNNYNRAFSAVLDVCYLNLSPSGDRTWKQYPPAKHGRDSHGYITDCKLCAAMGQEKV